MHSRQLQLSSCWSSEHTSHHHHQSIWFVCVQEIYMATVKPIQPLVSREWLQTALEGDCRTLRVLEASGDYRGHEYYLRCYLFSNYPTLHSYHSHTSQCHLHNIKTWICEEHKCYSLFITVSISRERSSSACWSTWHPHRPFPLTCQTRRASQSTCSPWGSARTAILWCTTEDPSEDCMHAGHGGCSEWVEQCPYVDASL